MVLGMLPLPVGEAFAKSLTSTLDPLVVTMRRLAGQALCLAPVAVILRRRLRGAMFSPLLMLSGGLVAVTLLTLITAFSVMPIATAIAIFFVEPLILTLLAAPLLGEAVGPRRLAAVGVGLLGGLIVIRPGVSDFGWAALLPLVAALAYTLNMIVVRVACRTRSGLTVQCGATAYAFCAVAVPALRLDGVGLVDLAPAAMPLRAWGAVLGAGAFAAASFVLIAEAFRRTEAGLPAPFQYLEIVGVTAAVFLVFGDMPDALTWLGIAIILASGVYVFRREPARDASPTRRPPARRGRGPGSLRRFAPGAGCS